MSRTILLAGIVGVADADLMDAALQELRECLEAGFLLHGSKQKLEILEPRRARDTDASNVVGTQTAVYAASSLRIPIIKALIDIRDKSILGQTYGYEDDGNRMIVGGANFTFTPGFVYVLRPDSFIEITDNQDRRDIVSFEPVLPRDRIYVTPTILKRLNVCIID
jgi:hypothetical protein